MATTIQIKRSANVTAPTTSDLVVGELAYSQDKAGDGAGARLYIESVNSTNTPVIHTIGGKYYTDKVDASTSSNTANTLVQRDTSGNFTANTITATTFVGNISGQVTSANIANFANALTTPRTISLAGDVTGSVSFDGTQNVTINTTANINSVALGTDTTGDYVANVLAGTGIQVTGQGGETATPTVALTNTGVTANTYGGISTIPVLVVDAQGRITAAANSDISVATTAFTTIAVAGQNNVVADSGSDTVTFVNGTGITITTNDTADSVTFTLNNTAVTPSTYGGTTQIPVLTVDQQGRITSAANASITTSFTIEGGDNNTDTFNTGDRLIIDGQDGISTTLSSEGNNTTVSVSLTTTGVAANTYGGTGITPRFTVDAYGRISSAANVTTTVANTGITGDIILGTQTAGDYLANVVPGTGLTGTGFGTEGATPTISLTNTGVAAATYGGAATQTVIAVDAQGRITSAANVTSTVANSNITGDIILGTQTAGDYLANVVPGTGLTGSGFGTEGATPTLSLTNTGVSASTYGGAAVQTIITVDAQGRITSAANVTSTVANTNITGNIISSQIEPTAVTPSTYGGTGKSSVITVDQQGRITSAANADITSSLVGDSGTGSLNLATQTLAVKGGTGISTSVSSNTFTITNSGVTSLATGGYGLTVSASTGAVTVTNTGVTRAIAGTGIGVDTNNGNVTFTNLGVTSLTGTANEVTVSSANGAVQIGLPDDVTITRDLAVLGNLNVTGNVITHGADNLVINDSLIQLANNNISSDIIDIGFYGSYNADGGAHEHAGLFRDASDGRFKLFQGLQGNENLTSTINVTGTGYTAATLVADLIASNANVYTALSIGSTKNQIVPLASNSLEVRGGLGDAAGSLSLAAGNYPTAYSKIFLESAKKITLQADEAYVTLFNDGNTKLITMNTTHTTAVSTTTGALRVSGGVGVTGNIYADYFEGKIDGGSY